MSKWLQNKSPRLILFNMLKDGSWLIQKSTYIFVISTLAKKFPMHNPVLMRYVKVVSIRI